MSFDTAQDKAVDALLDSHGYTGAALTPQADGSIVVAAERRPLLHNGRFRLDATVTADGEVIDKKERDW